LNEFKHPDANRSSQPWATSAKGKEWKAAGFNELQGRLRSDGTAWQSSKEGRREGAAPGGQQRREGRDQGRKTDSRKWYNLCTVLPDFDDTHAARVLHDTVPMTIHINNHSLTVNVLVDTGAIQANYLDHATAEWIATRLAEDSGEKRRTDSQDNPSHECCNFDKKSSVKSSCISCAGKGSKRIKLPVFNSATDELAYYRELYDKTFSTNKVDKIWGIKTKMLNPLAKSKKRIGEKTCSVKQESPLRPSNVKRQNRVSSRGLRIFFLRNKR
jgi:hypothetical protein